MTPKKIKECRSKICRSLCTIDSDGITENRHYFARRIGKYQAEIVNDRMNLINLSLNYFEFERNEKSHKKSKKEKWDWDKITQELCSRFSSESLRSRLASMSIDSTLLDVGDSTTHGQKSSLHSKLTGGNGHLAGVDTIRMLIERKSIWRENVGGSSLGTVRAKLNRFRTKSQNKLKDVLKIERL